MLCLEGAFLKVTVLCQTCDPSMPGTFVYKFTLLPMALVDDGPLWDFSRPLTDAVSNSPSQSF